jgi:hypothetical protein
MLRTATVNIALKAPKTERPQSSQLPRMALKHRFEEVSVGKVSEVAAGEFEEALSYSDACKPNHLPSRLNRVCTTDLVRFMTCTILTCRVIF